MALFSKPPLHVRVLSHPVMGWAQVGLVAIGALSLIGQTAGGVVQALRRKPEAKDQPTPAQ